jgi:hypothetical protein
MSRDYLFFDSKNRLELIRKSDFKFVTQFTLESKEQIFASAVVDEKFLYCGGWKKKLYYIDLENLKLIRNIECKQTITNIIEYQGHLFIG